MSNPNHSSHQLTLQKINELTNTTESKFQLIFNSLQMLNNQFGAIENLFILTLEQLDIPEDKEINYTQEAFEDKYAHLIGGYFIEKKSTTFYKIESILKDWEATSHEGTVWKFIHPDKGEKIITANDERTAYSKLAEEIRNPLTMVTEEE
jgi:hypothetical protein